MSGVAPSPAVVAAASVPAFVLANVNLAEILAPLAPFTTPERFQQLLMDLASSPAELERFGRKYVCFSDLCRWPAWSLGDHPQA
jgi:hypothetical protein